MGGGESQNNWKGAVVMVAIIIAGFGFLIFLGFHMKADIAREDQEKANTYRSNMATATAVRQDTTHYWCRINTGSAFPLTVETVGQPFLEEGATYTISHGQSPPEARGGKVSVTYEKESHYIFHTVDGQTIIGNANLAYVCAGSKEALTTH